MKLGREKIVPGQRCLLHLLEVGAARDVSKYGVVDARGAACRRHVEGQGLQQGPLVGLVQHGAVQPGSRADKPSS